MKCLYRRILLAFLLISSICGRISAQISLSEVLKIKDDSIRIFKLSDAAFELAANKPDSGLKYAFLEMSEADKTKKPLLIANALNDIATCHYYLSNFDSCIRYSKKALEIRKKLNRPDLEISSLNKIGISYQESGRLKEASTTQFEVLKLAEKTNNYNHLASTHNNLSFLFYNLKDYQSSLSHAKQAYKFGNISGNKMVVGEALASMANVFEIEQKFDSAITKLETAKEIFEEEGNLKNLASAHQSLGIIYRKLKNNKSALSNYLQAYQIAKGANNVDDKAYYAANIASILIEEKEYGRAKSYLYETKIIAESKKNFDVLKELYPGLMLYHVYSGSKDSAQYYFGKANEIKDSILNIETVKEVGELNVLYQTEKRKAEIATLNEKNALQEIVLRKRNTWLAAILGLLLFSVVVLWGYLRLIKNKQKIALQKAIIKEQDEAAKAIISAEENERSRMSQTLHDGLGQLLSAAKMNLQAVQGNLQLNPQMTTAYDNALKLVDDSIKEMRTVSHQMVTNNVVRTGLANALKELIEKIESDRLKVNLNVSGLLQNINPDIQIVVYRIIQESINNVIKHAQADTLNIGLNMNGPTLTGSIADNGIGFNTSATAKRGGIGLDNIATRIKFLKGHYNIQSEPGKGTQINFEIPL